MSDMIDIGIRVTKYLLENIVKSVAVAKFRLYMLSVDFQSWLLFEWSGQLVFGLSYQYPGLGTM